MQEKMRIFLGFGYITQLTSFATLLLSTVILPNIIGMERYAELNVWLALVMLPGGFLAEAVSFQISNKHNFKDNDFFAIKNILFVALECFGISSLLFFVIFLVGGAGAVIISGFENISELILPFLSILFLSLYMVIVGWFRALFSNKNTLKLVVVNGTLNFVVPIFFYFLKINFSYVPFTVYLLSFVYASLLLVSGISSKLNWHQKGRYHLILINNDFLLFVLPTFQRSLLIWLPVLWLSAYGTVSEQSAYKIAISIALGGISLVPFPRETVFSISMNMTGQGTNKRIFQLSTVAVLVAAVGSVMLYFLRNIIVNIFYSAEFSEVAEFLQIISFFIVLQVTLDVLTNKMISARQKYNIYFSFLISIIMGGVAISRDLIQWVPIFMASGFILTALLCMNRNRKRKN